MATMWGTTESFNLILELSLISVNLQRTDLNYDTLQMYNLITTTFVCIFLSSDMRAMDNDLAKTVSFQSSPG